MARRNRHPSGIKRIGIAALVCIILLGFISYPLLHQQEKSISITRHITKPRRIQSSASKPRILPHFPMARNPCSQQLPSHLLHHRQSRRTHIQGKKTIDKMWKESGIDTIRSVEKKSEAFYQFIIKSNEFITTTYPQTFSKDIAGSKKADIIYELSSYTTERYVKPTLSSFQSSK